ncbi:MAG: hypothetical protein JO182_16515 [Acidobacteriaceae bacterium]|nr:hypothetical protein [Acidobacteriaceae bacterium]MBV9036093.1 hypothetical protein [Acidobacteriaceae bacterium]MBV9304985.1 hypothetical protein [Acidobacteriaceae bacterium]MBV9676252.1 hypothetical protein [Acidobacteriaceae bacterium]
MASVTATSSSNTINPYGSTNNSSNSAANSSSGGTNGLANESTFLTLLVAQLQNQDPLQPADGMQFVTQLAQFSSLEQNLAMRTDLDSIQTKVASMGSSGTAQQ